jgi:hypothetical protein
MLTIFCIFMQKDFCCRRRGKSGALACPPKLGPAEMRDSCRIATGGSNCESKKIFGGAGVSNSPGG